MVIRFNDTMYRAAELRDAVNEQLLAMAKDGTMLKIAENYVKDGLVLESLCMLG